MAKRPMQKERKNLAGKASAAIFGKTAKKPEQDDLPGKMRGKGNPLAKKLKGRKI